MITTRNLTRSFAGRLVLDGIDLSVDSGERVAILGANGSGKTTLLRILSTLLAPSRGEVWIMGQKVCTQLKRPRRLVSWCPASDGGFIPKFTGAENLKYWGALYGMSSHEVSRSIKAWGNSPTLSQSLETPFQSQSTGMQQSLNLARALLKNAPIILLDEPTRGLDADTVETLYDGIERFLQGKTLIFSSHSVESIDRLATRKLTLRDGKVHA